MKRLWIAPLVACATAASLAVAGTSTRPAAEARSAGDERTLDVGSTVPSSVKLHDLDGKTLGFDELRGKVAVVHFWSDRCPAEKHADPVFLRMEKQYAGNADVVMVGIASNQNELGEKPGEGDDYADHYKNLREKRAKVGYEHRILVDHGNEVSDLFQARSTPHCFVLDKDGVIRYAGALDDDPRGSKGEEATNYVVDAVAAVLAGKPVEVEKTKPYG